MAALEKIDEALLVVADSTRRRVLQSLKIHSGGQRAGDIAKLFPDISRPAVSRHLRLLREAGFVEEEWKGRECWYRINAKPLKEIHAWAAQYEQLWMERLGRLKTLVESETKSKKE
jgi:DNA-binding transcriptional ArsR family regulator